MMSYRSKVWTAAAETGSCVHLTNAQPNKKKKSEKEGREEEARGGERERKKRRKVKFKIFNPPSINSPCRDGNTTCTVHLKRERGGKGGEGGMANCGRRPLSSSIHGIQLSIFSMMSSLSHSHFTFTSICSLPPSFHGRSASRTHMLTSPPSPPHLRDVRCMTRYEASCSGRRDPDTSRSPLFFFFSCLFHPVPFLHTAASSDRTPC